MENTNRKLTHGEIEAVAGGKRAEAEAWLKEYMAHFGLTSREEAFAMMTPEQKEVYRFHLNAPVEYDDRVGLVDQR